MSDPVDEAIAEDDTVTPEELQAATAVAQEFIKRAHGDGLTLRQAAMAFGIGFIALAERDGIGLQSAMQFVEIMWSRVHASHRGTGQA